MTEPDETTLADYEALRHGVGGVVLPRDVLAISGPDAVEYLQGQCSQDVATLAEGESADALLLSPQGKVDASIRVTRRAGDAFLIDTDAGFGEVAQARLLRFRLRVKVDIEPLPWICLAVRGPGSGSVPPTSEPGVFRLPVEWPGLSGFDLIGPAPSLPETVRPSGIEAWEAVRIEAGVPMMGREVTENTIPAEAGLVEHSVSFTKGCFTGQELVARLDARGTKVARRLCGVVVDDPERLPPVGATVHTTDGEHQVGQLTSVAWSPGLGSTVALATLQRRVAPPAAVSVRWDENGHSVDVGAEAKPLPLVG
ncbi:MAG TPA: glycine cleavage T C-terminal barrel domain-containing protein [Acidimicrobiales bacterium]|jgi:folate-binding protein YgfZ|nr:glycine cleavage T C-terminal barrel domain-containing protein [Acidimicrobiales bacterium]